ncbi:MAG: GH3 auxin-responsive promoter family protein, partial [Gammaproteobacteria bacterium]|nr:GH3 auxin-responsive promoter family protein [candidate division Zixibacteria bacterium]NIR92357.1 GH3 auxin-responsive promoter family protein [Gammaproteobacteria bacterium]NIT56731.1 GH3 auxin-responsive promoter family protein [Fodinibius sp.]NIR63783.1 GH3 auxin-responsive promoter family protein [candidate division Zixibacteria bacterium]NIS45741.1 GH3 auxin-responsive promoter family protein [candidate division Zixibacteria bacterium]
SLESSGVPYTDWVARKEVDEGHVKLHIYIEPKSEVDFPMDDVIHKIDRYFLENLSEYRDMKEMFQYEPLIISLLPVGAFMAYMKAQQEAGADLAHIKPPHIQPNETVMGSLLGDELE